MKELVKSLCVAALAAMLVFVLAGCGDAGRGHEEPPPPPPPVDETDDDAAISAFAIIVTAPVKGATPSTTATLEYYYAEDNGNFTIASVSWTPTDNPFLGGKVYTVSVTLTAENNYTFAEGIYATINGYNANIVNNTETTVRLSRAFPETDTRTVTDFTIVSQPAKLNYTHGDTLDLTGLEVTLTYDSGTQPEKVSAANFWNKNITVTPLAGNSLFHSTHDRKRVKITYGNFTRETDILIVDKATPKLIDYNISGIVSVYDGTVYDGPIYYYYDGNPKAVAITPKMGKSKGEITVKYDGSTTEPSAIGTYEVTFNVAGTEDFNASTGEFAAGTMTIAPFTDRELEEWWFLALYLENKPVNTKDTPYIIAINLSSLDVSDIFLIIKYSLRENSTKYVSIDFSGSIFTSIPNNAFSSDYYEGGCTTLTGIILPDCVTDIGNYAFSGCSNLTSIDIPDGVTRIGNYAFSRCTNLTSIDIPDSVESIGGSAFTYCTGLTSIDIPDSVESIGVCAFLGCTCLTSVTLPNNAAFTTIGYYNPDYYYDSYLGVFSYCTSLESIVIPNSVTSIGNYTFLGCEKLTSVTIPSGVTIIGEGAFSNCYSLTSVTIPSGVTSIEDRAFAGCTNLTSVNIPSGVTSIGESAFWGCENLTSVTIPNSVGWIGRGAFAVTGLTSVTIPNGVTSIGDYAFYECTGLISVTIPSDTSIGDYAFSGCTGLTSITIPSGINNSVPYSGVNSIGNGAFSGCTNLISVTLGFVHGDGSFNDDDYNPFDGDLSEKFYSNSSNGNPGTYTTTAPVNSSSVWVLTERFWW